MESNHRPAVYEGAGKKEDHDLKRYFRELKQSGSPFDQTTSHSYQPLTAHDFRRIVLGDAHQKTKLVPMLQIADLMLYPIAKGGYDHTYPPYQKLQQGGKLIDSCFVEEDRPLRGIKYSCFEITPEKPKGPDFSEPL